MTNDSRSGTPPPPQLTDDGYIPASWWYARHAWVVSVGAAALVFPGPKRPLLDAALLFLVVPITELLRWDYRRTGRARLHMGAVDQVLVGLFLLFDPAVEAPAAFGSLAACVAAGAFAGPRAAVIAASIATVTFSASAYLDGTAVVSVPVILMNWAAGLVVARLAASYRKANRDAGSAAIALQEALEDLRAATSSERELLADRLHDRPVQSLVTASFLVERNPERARVFIEQALSEIRNEIWASNPVIESPDSEALAVATMERLIGAGVSGDLNLADWVNVPARLRPLVWRTIGEAITNMLKHGNAVKTSIDLEVDDKWVKVEVADDAPEGAPSPINASGDSGYGLRSLVREWEHLGGGLVGGSRAGGGYVLRCWVPRFPDATGS